MKEIKISTKNKYNEKLIGLETVPDTKKEKYPTIILVHGFGADKNDYGLLLGLSKKLSKEDFLVFRFDFSGCGESEGNYSETSLTKLKEDFQIIFDFVKKQEEVDKNKIGIYAHSMGTGVILAFKPKEIKVLVLGGAHFDIYELISKHFKKGFNPKGISKLSRSNSSITKIKPSFWKDLKQNWSNLKNNIKDIDIPTLFLHGTKDSIIPKEQSKELYKLKKGEKELIFIKGGEHGFEPYREKAYKLIINWFKKYLI